MEPMAISFTGIIHFPRLQDRLATHFVPFSEFERDAAAGTLPDFSLIEPNMISGHGDYHPAMGRSFSKDAQIPVESPSSMLAGEAFLARVFAAYRSATSDTGPNVWDTALLIGWDEPGGTYDHVPPGPVAPPIPPIRLVSAALRLTARATACRRSWCRPEMGITLPPELDDPNTELTPKLIMQSLWDISGHFFPLLATRDLD